MADKANNVAVQLQPLGKTLAVESGTVLQDVLFPLGVEFPCGGRGVCQGCKVRVLDGSLTPCEREREVLTPEQLDDGWRLSCQARVEADVTLDLAQWEVEILADETYFHFEPHDGYGIAIDIGTTTLVAQLLSLSTAQVVSVRSALNPQAQHGGDIMSRIDFSVNGEGQKKLRELIRGELGGLVDELVEEAGVARDEIHRCVIVGNTVMHHLFCGYSVEPLSRYPFESPDLGHHVTDTAELGWSNLDMQVEFLACMGGFIGSDVLAGVLATELHESEDIEALVDLGTNGEIVMGNKHGLHCAATAAGPAFEGARISMGMRAASGAVFRVRAEGSELCCTVVGHTEPRGICGSGLVDAVAAACEANLILPTGRLSDGSDTLTICDPVALTQTDIRQLQLAKGAIAAGIQILAARCGIDVADIKRLHLAGAFGNYISTPSARRIGLIALPEDRIVPAGNTALLGAKMALFSGDSESLCAPILNMTRHVSLSSDPEFQEIYVDQMTFPE